ncbi:twin-arginine translocase subunit TatC [Desertihabitans brevis]|uniref:Sec-independent protein translocase protein TatC n=2 Tax=Desertihabitans brevis TaxID=2268447 RepID=A0A367Z0E8_9ACTN|nr:twin-arginine translocase subunit TatC [Desertihabitans brevis]
MSIWDHLRELRYRLTIAVIAVVVVSVLSAIFFRELYALVAYPYNQAAEMVLADNPGADISLVNSGIAAPFLLVLRICGFAGLILSAPIWLYQLWAFIAPALLAREKKWALAFIGSATPLFLGGVGLAYLLMPTAMAVMLGFTVDGTTNLIDGSDYLGFVMQMMVVFGVAFLLPVVVVALNIMGIVKATQLSQARTIVIFGSFVVGAVATPSTDPFSMLALAVPLSLLFVLAEIICHANDRRRARRRPAEEAAVGTPELTS